MIFDYIDNGIGDDVGFGFVKGDKYYRKILPLSVDNAKDLLNSGLIDKLTIENIFPRTKIVSEDVKDQTLLISHELLGVLVHPGYWSPKMLKSAGLLVLRINEIASTYGYELADIHPFNIVYNGVNPVFVDFGSFKKIKNEFRWCAHDQFLKCYIYPLIVFSYGLDDYYFRIFKINGIGISDKEMLLVKSPFLRLLSPILFRQFFRAINKFRRSKDNFINLLVSYFSQNKEGRGKHQSSKNRFELSRLRSRLEKVSWSDNTQWGDYHGQFYDDSGNILITPRFQTVSDFVKKIESKVVLELAANQGVLSRILSELYSVKTVLSTDYDASAIDANFSQLDASNNVYPCVWNFMTEPLGVRLHGLSVDLVVALAVVHHLSLTQGYPFSAIIKKLLSFTSRHAIIEFMPLGLWDGKNSPNIPDWYNISKFEEVLSEFSIIMHKEQLEENRVMYLIEKRDV
jgi:hypothetical protein